VSSTGILRDSSCIIRVFSGTTRKVGIHPVYIKIKLNLKILQTWRRTNMGIHVRDYRRSKRAERQTTAGSVDDNATKRAKENKEDKEKTLQQIFDDNTTGRYSSD